MKTNPPPQGNIPDEKMNKQLLNAAGAVECPKWIADMLGAEVHDVAALEITCTATILYSALIEFLSITSVDVTQPPPKKIDSSSQDPESPGILSTLWTGLGSGCKPKFSVDEPSEGKFHLGLGYSRALANEKDVFIAHVARGNPIEVSGQSRLFRAIHLFAASPVTLKALVKDALAWHDEHEKEKLNAQDGMYVLYTLIVGTSYVRWVNHGQKDARPLCSVFLRKGLKETVLKDAKSFISPNTKKWYLSHGVPYRRSYLFYGPPGVGKTSLIRAIAGELKLTTCFLCLADKNMGNRQLLQALENVPQRSMVVLEDIDVLFNEERKQLSEASLTFSGLLNALDGLVSADGVLTVMTTNHIARLDPALIRAGRVDRRFKFSAPEREQVKELFQSFYPDAEKELAKKFSDLVFMQEETAARSIATLQQHFVYTRENTAEESLELVPEFFNEFYSSTIETFNKTLYA